MVKTVGIFNFLSFFRCCVKIWHNHIISLSKIEKKDMIDHQNTRINHVAKIYELGQRGQHSTIFHIKVIITHQPKTHHEAYALVKKTYVSMTMALDDAHIKDDAVKRHCFSLSPYISQGYTNHEIRHMAGLVLTQQFELIFQGCPLAMVNLRKRMRQIL